MLCALRISNFAVIDEAEVTFGAGLTVLTGETGTGKSILVDALGLVLGGRADPEVIRAGADEAVVEAAFIASPAFRSRLEAAGIPVTDGEVSVRRVVSRAGRGKAHLNGSLVTVGVLAQLIRGEVDISGQHEHVSLFDPALHRELLDRAGGLEDLKAGFAAAYAALRAVDLRIEALGGDERRGEERAEALRFARDELVRFVPKPGEEAALEVERRRLSSADRLGHAAAEAEELLTGAELGALERLGRAARLLGDAGRLDPGIAALLTPVQAAASELDEVARGLSRYRAGLELDPQRLAEVDERLDALKRLCRKHGTDAAGLCAKRDELEDQLGALEHRTERVRALAAEREAALAEARARAQALSSGRAEAAGRFSRSVRACLGELAFGKAAFEAVVTPGEALAAHGLDGVEFHFSANPGEPLKPLLKVASGGEASRVLLALKRVLARHAGAGTYVLDEVDAGVGGAVAEVVGRMIREVSGHHQVLCVTHLPQVAAFADQHVSLVKEQSRGRTVSRIVPLEGTEARTRELARMLSGVEVTREAAAAASALVRAARSRRGRVKILQSA